MKPNMVKEEILNHIDDVLKDYNNLNNIYFESINKFPFIEIERIITRFRALIERFCNKNSPYFKQIKTILLTKHNFNGEKIPPLLGVIQAFRSDVEADYLKNLEDIIHGDMFSDFLEMSEYLLKEGYKDAAAVIVGSTLESHLRLLCQKNSIEIVYESRGKTRPKNADRMNNDLAGGSVYTRLDQGNIKNWLRLRNNAAHGKYTMYDEKQVEITIMGVQDFIRRNPA